MVLTTPTPTPDQGNCLCIFDVDRTLTAQQKSGPDCKNTRYMPGIEDTAYDGGQLVLSEVGQSLVGTFCDSCYVGVVSAGDAGAAGSAERAELVRRLDEKARLVSTEWGGPSKEKEARRDCTVGDVTSTLMLGCNDGTKQIAVKGIVEWLQEIKSIPILPERVWMFDDRENNIAPFHGTGFNARMISCGTRDRAGGAVGLCGAIKAEIVNNTGVALCPSAAMTV